MERFHRGIGEKGFFQKNVDKGPKWLERVTVPKKDGVVNYPVVTRRARPAVARESELHHAARLDVARAASALSRPLRVRSRSARRRRRCAAQRGAARARRARRARLHQLGEDVRVEGFHVAVPLDGSRGFRDRSHASRTRSARALVQRDPAHLTQEFYKSDRGGRILVDTGRNEFGATFAAAYAVRPKPHAPVSAPCTWEEVESGRAEPQSFTLRTMARTARRGR